MNRTIERSRQARSEGKLWRAKEILQGRISSHPYDPEVMEEYGSVLLQMGDDLEAGKYLFISGVRASEYQASIGLFLDRFVNSTAIDLHASLPARARAVPIEQFPESVANELQERGLSSGDINKYLREPIPQMSPTGEALAKYGCLTLVGLILLLFGVGVLAGIQRVVKWFL